MAARHCMLLLACGLVLTGCRRQPLATPATQAGTTGVTASLRSPEDAARSLMELLRAQLAAVAGRDRAAAARYRDQVAQEIVARDDVMARYNTLTGRTARTEDEVLHRLVESWAAAIAYYADGLDLQHMRLSAVAGQSGKAVVEIPAHGPNDEALLNVACLRGADERWRVVGVEFALPEAPHATTLPAQAAPASREVTQPASASAPTVP
jgi:hypothetical protein